MPFIISNIRMLKIIPGYELFSLANYIPSIAVGVFFSALIITGYAVYGIRERSRYNRIVLPMLVTIFVLSSTLSDSSFYEIIQGIVVFLSPVLVYYSIKNSSGDTMHINTVIKFYFIVGLINVLPALYTFYHFGLQDEVYFIWNGTEYNRYDSVNGFFSDSHSFSIYFYFLTALAYFQWKSKNKRKYIILAASYFIVGSMGYNIKALFIILFVVFVYAILWLYRNTKFVYLVFVLMLLMISSGFLIQTAMKIDDRIELLWTIPFSEQPLVAPIAKIADVIQVYPLRLIFGAGIGNYGSTIAISRANATGYISDMAKEFNETSILIMTSDDVARAENVSSFIQLNMNTFTTTLVEFGLISGLLLFYFYWNIVYQANRISKIHPELVAVANTITFYMLIIFLNSLLSLWSSFDDYTSILPPIVLSGLLQRDYSKKKF